MDLVSVRGGVDITITHDGRLYVVHVKPRIDGCVDADLWLGDIRVWSMHGLYMPYLRDMWGHIWEAFVAGGGVPLA